MWCRNCNLETNEEICPVCGKKTEEDMPIDVNWCKECKIPIIKYVNEEKETCPLCGKNTKHLATDLRPVFPQERLLMELIIGAEPNEYIEESVWASSGKYFINGKSVSISSSKYNVLDADIIRKKLEEYAEDNTDIYFEEYIENFIEANKDRLNYIKDEATEFVKKSVENFDEERTVISFSGGKDSTATADLNGCAVCTR